MYVVTGLKEVGHKIEHNVFFDTLKVNPETDISEIKHRATQKEINLRYYPDGTVANKNLLLKDFNINSLLKILTDFLFAFKVGLSLDERIKEKDLDDLLWIFMSPKKAVSAFLFIYILNYLVPFPIKYNN